MPVVIDLAKQGNICMSTADSAVETNDTSMTPDAFGGGTATAMKTLVRPSKVTGSERQLMPPYAVVLHNDEINTMDFVVETLQKVFRYDLDKATLHVLEVNHTGQSVVWTGAKEHAELKADQIISVSRCPDPMMKHAGVGTLRVTIEPLPAN